MIGKDKPRIRQNSSYRSVKFWVCRKPGTIPGIGFSPLKAWNDWVYINGLDHA